MPGAACRLFLSSHFSTEEKYGILTLYIWAKGRNQRMMTFFKVLFCILLCSPLAYGVAYLLANIAEDAIKKR